MYGAGEIVAAHYYQRSVCVRERESGSNISSSSSSACSYESM
jgi:hypothetical protein